MAVTLHKLKKVMPLPLYQETVDDIAYRLSGATVHTENFCIHCQQGHICCTEMVAVSLIEALIIAKHLIENDLCDTVMPQLRENSATIALVYAGRDFYTTPERESLAADWFDRQQPCVFYDGMTKRCTIYPIRPVMCRLTFGYSHTWCANGGSTLIMEPRQTSPEFQLVLASVRELGATEKECVGELNSHILYALQLLKRTI